MAFNSASIGASGFNRCDQASGSCDLQRQAIDATCDVINGIEEELIVVSSIAEKL